MRMTVRMMAMMIAMVRMIKRMMEIMRFIADVDDDDSIDGYRNDLLLILILAIPADLNSSLLCIFMELNLSDGTQNRAH